MSPGARASLRTLSLAFAWLVVVFPVVVGAQVVKTHRLGVLAQDLQPGLLETVREELGRLGRVEGRNITIDVRNAGGRSDRLPALIEELLRLKVDVILAVNTPSAQAAKKATSTVPI